MARRPKSLDEASGFVCARVPSDAPGSPQLRPTETSKILQLEILLVSWCGLPCPQHAYAARCFLVERRKLCRFHAGSEHRRRADHPYPDGGRALRTPDIAERRPRTLQGAIGARGARYAAQCELFWRTFPAGEASPSIASHARSFAPRASPLYGLLCCASCVSLLGRCERGGRAERLQAPPAHAGSTPRAARLPGMSRACRCPLGCRSQASRSQARLVCRQQTCCGRSFVAWG